MKKKKKVKTIIVEKFKYNNDDDYGVTLAPELLLKLFYYSEFYHGKIIQSITSHVCTSKRRF